MITTRDLLRSAALSALTGTTMMPGPAGSQAKAEWPDIREAKAIPEEGFIYGLPIVMNYAAMYEFSVDRNSSQFKASFNQLRNEAYVATYKDTAAKSGLYGTDAVEEVYPFTKLLASGDPLDGSEHNCTLTFPAGEPPAVETFWSVTIYDGKT
ncbi:hypothetical protein ACVWZL_001419 [Bradyrhizobium sp. GM2.4]